MKGWITPLATIAGTAVMLASAQAQTVPTTTQTDAGKSADSQVQKPKADKAPATAAQGKKSDKKADTGKADAADDAEPKPLYNNLSLSYNTWSHANYLKGLQQNGFINGGFGIADLSVLSPYLGGGFTAFELKGNPGDDFGLRLINQWGSSTSLSLHAHQFSFFDTALETLEPSRDKSYDVTVDERIAPNFGAFATYQYDQNEHHVAAPLPETNFINKTLAVGTQRQFGENTLGATYTETRFSDLTQAQPIALTDRAEFRYLGNWGPRLSTEGTAAISRIQQQGRSDSWIRDYALSGVYDVSDVSALGAHISQSVFDLRSVANAYVRKRVNSGLTYDTQLGKWGAGLGFQHRVDERVRADQSYIDTPTWNSYNFKLNGYVAKGYRLGFKGSVEDLSSEPLFQTDDPTLLYWDRKATFQAKLSGGNERTTSYLSYTYRYRRNEQRELSINWNNVALGGSKVFNSKLLGYAEFASDHYIARGDSPVATPLGDYFPSSETFLVGLDYTRNAREGLSLVLSSFYTQDQWGQQIALTYRRDLGKERNFQITYSPWLQRDRLYDVDSFDARILTMKLETRF